MIHSFLLILLASISISCSKDIKIIGASGTLINAERRMPLYNRQMIDNKDYMSKQIPQSRQSHYRVDEAGDKYYSTGRIETRPVPKSIVTTPQSNDRNIAIESKDTGFVPINDINLNENKNIPHTKDILLNRQNITTKNEYIPKKQIKKVSPPKKNKIQRIQNQKEKIIPQNIQSNDKKTLPIKNDGHNLFFIKVIESDSILDVSDKIKEIKPSLDNYVVEIEDDKKNNIYQLIIGPITGQKEAVLLKEKLIKMGNKGSVIFEK